MSKQSYQVKGGFLTRGPTLDSLRGRVRDDAPNEREEEVIEIHNHIPELEGHIVAGENIAPQDRQRDEEREDPDVVARYPATYHAATEGDEIVIYRRYPPKDKTDIYDFDVKARDNHPHPPRTLRELNQFFAQYYRRPKAAAAR